MKCQNCGAELPDDSQFCNKCGTEVICEEEIKGNQTEQQHLLDNVFTDNENVVNKPIPAKKNNTIITILLIGVICFLIVGFYFIYPYLKYSSAQGLVSSHQYDKAITAFTELGNYKDSKDKILNCKYNLAKNYMSKNDYTNAVKIFSELKDYKDATKLEQKCYYEQAQKLAEKEQYEQAINMLSKSENYLDSQNLLQKYLVEYGIQTYDTGKGDFDKTMKIFNRISKENIWKVDQYIKNIESLKRFQGNWVQKENRSLGLKITGSVVTRISSFEKNDNVYVPEGNKLIGGYVELYFENNILVEKVASASGGNFEINHYIEGNAESVTVLQEPQIGMTKDEVEKSSWGEPEKINKTTTASTVHEQWVYSNNRYLYLDNGIVTAIQN